MKKKNVINFSVKGILEFYDSIVDDPEFIDLYKKEGDPLYAKFKKSGTKLNNKISLAYHQFELDLSCLENVNIEVVKKLMYDPELNICWDKGIKSYTILKGNESSYLYRKSFYSPIFLISERDRVDKHIEFKIEERYFNFSSSVEDGEFYDLDKSLVRVKNYYAFYSFYFVTTETKKKVVFHGLNQIDAKINLPDWIFNITVPMKTKAWYASLYDGLKAYNEFGYEGVKKLKG